VKKPLRKSKLKSKQAKPLPHCSWKCKRCDAARANGRNVGKGYHDQLHVEQAVPKSASLPIPKLPNPLPDIGRLRGTVLGPDPKRVTIFAAATGNLYPKPPSIRLEGIRPIQVLQWAEEWREHYDSRGYYLTLQALRGMVQHSSLPVEDHGDADLVLRALYADEIAMDTRRYHHERLLYQQRVEKAAAELKKKTEIKPADKPTNNWSIPVEQNGGKYKIFGFNVTSVIRWMGADAWTEKDTRLALNLLGLKEVSDNTIKAQLRAGRDGSKEPASLSSDQDEKLNSILAEPPKTSSKKEKPMKNIWSSKGSRGKGVPGMESKKPKTKKVFGDNRAARRSAKKGRKS
jgi:hypothetical protein